MNDRLTTFVSLVGNTSQVIIAGSILAELYMKLRNRKKAVAGYTRDDGDDDPSPSTPISNAAA